MDTFKTMEGERIEQLERDKVALMAEIQDLKRETGRLKALLRMATKIEVACVYKIEPEDLIG